MTSSILTAWRRAVWWDRFGNPTIRFIMEDWTLSMNFCCPGLSLKISKLYKRDGNPMVFHKCTLTSVASPGYEQPTEAKAYMARRDAFTRLSIWASHDMLDVNIVPRISNISAFFILCPPRFQDGYLMKGFLLDIIQCVLLIPKLKRHFLEYIIEYFSPRKRSNIWLISSHGSHTCLKRVNVCYPVIGHL